MTDNEAFDRIESALSRLAADVVPPAGWEERVLAAGERRKRRRAWGVALPTLAAAAALLAWWMTPRSEPSMSPLLTVEVMAGQRVLRGASAHVGDTLIVKARGANQRALWLYRRDELLLACPGDARCRMGDVALDATLALPAVGEYSIVGLSSSRSIPAPRGKLDDDVAAAQRAGADYQIEALTVR